VFVKAEESTGSVLGRQWRASTCSSSGHAEAARLAAGLEASFEHMDFESSFSEFVGGREACDPGAEHGNLSAARGGSIDLRHRFLLGDPAAAAAMTDVIAIYVRCRCE
jgi:hypothetical protein